MEKFGLPINRQTWFAVWFVRGLRYRYRKPGTNHLPNPVCSKNPEPKNLMNQVQWFFGFVRLLVNLWRTNQIQGSVLCTNFPIQISLYWKISQTNMAYVAYNMLYVLKAYHTFLFFFSKLFVSFVLLGKFLTKQKIIKR